MISVDAVDLLIGDHYYDSQNVVHRITSKGQNIDEILPGGIEFMVSSGGNNFPEIFCRIERLSVNRAKHR